MQQQYAAYVAVIVKGAEEHLRARLGQARDFDDLEEASRRVGQQMGRDLLAALLQGADQELCRQRPKGWRLIGTRTRNLVSTVGPLPITRRLYKDQKGHSRFLLDEELGLAANTRMTPGLERIGVELCAQVPFGVAAGLLKQLVPAAPARQTLHKALGRLGEARQKEEQECRRRVFEDGEVLRGERKVARLFVEADGKWIHLQRTKGKKDLEMQVAFSHEGWEKAGKQRWQLKQKRVHISAESGGRFWEGFSVRLGEIYDLSQTRVVLGGDGADWVIAGREQFRECAGQLDRFHLAQALRKVLPKGRWRMAYHAASRGHLQGAVRLIRESEHPDAEKVIRYLVNNQDGLSDYRRREGFDDPALRTLGAAEGNVDKLVANRMCKRGMAWTVPGAMRMAKVLEASRNGELERHLARKPHPQRESKLRPALRRVAANAPLEGAGSDQWLRAALPAASTTRGFGPLLRRLNRPATLRPI